MRKRSKYRPRHVNPLAHASAIAGVHWLDDKTAESRSEALSRAVEAAKRGQATNPTWHTIFDAVNVLEALICQKVADGTVEPIKDMMEAIWSRRASCGSMALKHDERQLLDELAETFAAVLRNVTMAQLFAAEEQVAKTVARVLAGQRVPGTRVMEAA